MKKKQPEYKGKTTVRKGDDVVVLTGKDRGAHGKVLRVVPAKGRVVVEGVNLIKRATRPNPQKNIKGGIVEKEAADRRLERHAPRPGDGQADARRRPRRGGRARPLRAPEQRRRSRPSSRRRGRKR